MPPALDRFEAIVFAGPHLDFGRLALEVAVALTRATHGAIFVRNEEAIEIIASSLNAETLRGVLAMLDRRGDRGRNESDGACTFLSFDVGSGAAGVLCLEGAREPESARRVAEILSRRFSSTAECSGGERRAY